jgi:hypothetical protein
MRGSVAVPNGGADATDGTDLSTGGAGLSCIGFEAIATGGTSGAGGADIAAGGLSGSPYDHTTA